MNISTPPKRVLVINPVWPHPGHSTRAANVVVFELVAEMARRPDFEVGFLKLSQTANESCGALEEGGIAALSALGVEFLEPLVCPSAPVHRPSKVQFWLSPKEEYFYPEAVRRAEASAAAMAFRPDLIFIPWSETAASLFADASPAKFAYYGNPDTKSGWARAEFAREHGGSWLKYIALRVSLARMERFHLAIMKRYDYLGDVAANDANYYQRSGHPNAFYIRNVWLDRVGETWRQQRANERTDPFTIIGSIGKIDGTANTHGLEILLRDVTPELRRAMRGRAFEVHVCGAGKLNPIVADYLKSVPEVRMRGFVDDIDGEMMRAPVFMCLNNGSRYKVGHTRYLHAWSLGACVIGHRDAALSMPEMESGENCLLGASAAEIANMTRAVADDPALRSRLGESGYRTFREKFTAASAVDKISARLATSASAQIS